MPFKARMPRVDIVDRDDKIMIRAELLGVANDDLDVSMTEHYVTTRGMMNEEDKGGERR